MRTNLLVSSAAQRIQCGDAPSARIMYLPAGTHEVHATVNGKPKTLTVTVDASVFERFSAALAKRLKDNVRPYIDFDHAGTAAAAIPTGFEWVEGEGLYLLVEWTRAGEEAVTGRSYSYFSPAFLIGNDGTPTGLASQGPIGALVNDPAFRKIRRVAAHQTTLADPMDEFASALVKAGLLTTDQDVDEKAAAQILATLKAANARAETAESLAKTEKERADRAEAALTQARAEQADAALVEAIEAGRIPAKDEETKTFWRGRLLEDPAGAQKALASIPANPVTRRVLSQDQARGQAPQLGEVRAKQIRAKADELVKAGMRFDQAWQLAGKSIPE
jgi:phage I-like protein